MEVEAPASRPETIRYRIIAAASLVLSLGFLAGYPVSGWLYEFHPEDKTASLIAFHLAKTGVDRAHRMIEKSEKVRDEAAEGRTIKGYDNDMTYRDAYGGTYRVKVWYDPVSSAFRIIGTGLARKLGTSKTIEVVLREKAGKFKQVAWREMPNRRDAPLTSRPGRLFTHIATRW